MSEFDDLLTPREGRNNTAFNDQPFDKETWKQQKQEQRELVYGMIDSATEAVARDGTAFQKYLDVQSRFDRYSVSNALLILAQKPDATIVKDFDAWKEQGVFIRKKETGFYILEPGEEYQREDGSTGISYNPKKVFDVSQTGNSRKRETPTYPDERTRLKALMAHAPVPMHCSDTLPEGTNALYNPETREIQVRRGMAAASSARCRRSWLMPSSTAAMVTTAATSTVSMPTVSRICFAGNTTWIQAASALTARQRCSRAWSRSRSARNWPLSRRPPVRSPAEWVAS